MDSHENKPAEGHLVPKDPRLVAKHLYDFAMTAREVGGSEFMYDEEADVYRFRENGRFAFGQERADWQLLRKHGYLR